MMSIDPCSLTTPVVMEAFSKRVSSAKSPDDKIFFK